MHCKLWIASVRSVCGIDTFNRFSWQMNSFSRKACLTDRPEPSLVQLVPAVARIGELVNPVLGVGVDEGPLDALAENRCHPGNG